MKTAIELITEESNRHIEEEGFTPEHDDHHIKGELALAASAYAQTPKFRERRGHFSVPPIIWPWNMSWWKPSPENRIRELVKAGALIVKEIERLQRLEEKGGKK